MLVYQCCFIWGGGDGQIQVETVEASGWHYGNQKKRK